MKKKKSPIEVLETEFLHEAEDFVKNKVKKRVVKIGEMSAAFVVGFILIIIGLAQFMVSVFPQLENGLNYLLIGIIFILLGLVLR